MKLIQMSLPEVAVIDLTLFQDTRGWFAESYSERRFHDALRACGLTPPRPFVQDNHSVSAKGVLRGLHLQKPPYAQGKLVRVVAGAAFDVAVDVRVGSPTFGQWTGVELSATNHRMLWIPEGFAHGFMALEDDTHFLYKTTDYYARDCESAVRWDDPAIGIEWPALAPILAPKDADAPTLAEALAAGNLF